ncbi:MAG: glycoside hydrolase family 43 protein [Muribaculaceae bacterium]|nr:glycoside hydrolase family 43 protein [Muribaculaceae bacterium]
MKTKLTCITLAAFAVPALTGCLSGKAERPALEPQSSVAIFDSFEYSGNDSIYNANPLPDESSFYNPVLAGWYSDPSICTNGEGDYFIVTSTFTFFPGVPIFHSRDLVNWKQIGHVLSRPSQLRNMEKQHVSGGIFAPAISYNPANKTYYMITTNVGDGNFFVKTQDPFGEWSDPIMLPEVLGIDPAFFFDEDGKGYIVNNDDAPDGKPEYPGHRTVRVVEFDPATDKCVGERKIVINKGCRPEEKPIWCEGPHIYKENGKYYLMTAEGGTSTWHSEVIYRGDTPFGPYTPYKGNPILTQRTLDAGRKDPVTCAGHADLVKTPEGEWWGVFLGVRPVANDRENLGRETFMMPVKWTEDGWPYFMTEGETVPLVVSRPGVTRGEETTFGNYTRTDEFNDSTLGMEWMTLRGPATGYYSLTENPGYLTIKCAEVKSAEKAELPYVCRRINHHDFNASTNLTFVPETESQSAGILLLKDETHQYYLARTKKGDSHLIELRKVTDGGSASVASKELDPSLSSVDLKVKGKGLEYSFFYSTDAGKTWEPVAEGVDAGFTSTAEAGGFTGTVVGLYASGAE